MKRIFSVIIPVYNTEKYLEATIKSVLSQSFQNFELILINDGSKDLSGKICDEFKEKDNRIKVFHIKNSGVSTARNIGIKNSQGEWIVFLDSDDLLNYNALQLIYDKKCNNKLVDFISGSFSYIYESRSRHETNKYIFDNGINVSYEYGLWNIKICIGSFAVKKCLIEKNKILFDEDIKYGEDVKFINYCLLNSKKVLVIEEEILSYIIHGNSSISKVNFDRYDCCRARLRTLDYIKVNINMNEGLINLYNDYLVPQSIIDVTILLCSEGINIFKIKNYLKANNYNKILRDSKENLDNYYRIKKEIKLYLFSPILFWSYHFMKKRYYNFREKIGIIKRRILRCI